MPATFSCGPSSHKIFKFIHKFLLKKPFWSKIYYQINYAIHLYANLLYYINKANYKWQHMLNPRTFWLIFSNSFFDFLTWSSLTYQQILVSKRFRIYFSSADVFPNMNYSFPFLRLSLLPRLLPLPLQHGFLFLLDALSGLPSLFSFLFLLLDTQLLSSLLFSLIFHLLPIQFLRNNLQLSLKGTIQIMSHN